MRRVSKKSGLGGQNNLPSAASNVELQSKTNEPRKATAPRGWSLLPPAVKGAGAEIFPECTHRCPHRAESCTAPGLQLRAEFSPHTPAERSHLIYPIPK